MSNDNGGQDPVDRHIREAARWLVDLQDPDLSPEDLLRWHQWQESKPNREAFDSLASLWHVIHSVVEDINSPQRTAEAAGCLSEEAAYWYFLCTDNRGVSLADRREFLAWLRRSRDNVTELFRIAKLHGKLRRLKWALRPPGAKQDAVSERRLSIKLLAFGASLFFGVALAFVARDYMQPEHVVTTGASQWHHMTLPDGTAVHVDARSKVQVEYTYEKRIVHVYAGSAVFDVAWDPRRPFVARTHLIDAIALGTRFGVSIDPGVTTTVSDGVVRVTGHGSRDGKTLTLEAGQELRVSDSTLASTNFARVDAKRKLQWANGLLDLSGMTVSQGVAELNRRNRIQIVVDSPSLGARVIEVATIKVDAPEAYAKAVAQEPGVTMLLDKQNRLIRLSE